MSKQRLSVYQLARLQQYAEMRELNQHRRKVGNWILVVGFIVFEILFFFAAVAELERNSYPDPCGELPAVYGTDC